MNFTDRDGKAGTFMGSKNIKWGSIASPELGGVSQERKKRQKPLRHRASQKKTEQWKLCV
jgi:hypothetical protein